MVNREKWIDIARGVGIILVVWGHTVRGINAAGLEDSSFLKAMDAVIYLFHMSLFFFLSGINVNNSLTKGSRYYIYSKLNTIAYPYFVWSIIQFLILVIVGGSANSQHGLGEMVSILWAPKFQFWFLYALFICEILLLIVPRKGIGLALVAAILLVLSLVLPKDSVLRAACLGFFFIAGGMVSLADRIAGRWIFAAVATLGFVALAAFSVPLGLRELWPGLTIPAALCGIAMTIAFSKALRGPLADALSWLGAMSMSIYVAHTIFGAAVRIALVKLGVVNVPVHVACGVAVALVGPIVMHLAMGRLGVLPWFGLAKFGQRKRGRDTAGGETAVG